MTLNYKILKTIIYNNIYSKTSHRPFAVRHFGKTHKATLQTFFAKYPSSPSRTG